MSFNIEGYGQFFGYISGGYNYPTQTKLIGGKKNTKLTLIKISKATNLRKIKKEDYEIIVKTLMSFDSGIIKYYNCSLGTGNSLSTRNSPSNRVPKYIHIDTFPVSEKTETELRKNLIIRGEYGRLESRAGNLAWSIYKMFLREKVIHRFQIMKRDTNRILSDFARGDTIDILTRKYDQPPMNLMRLILTQYYKFNIDKAKKILQNPSILDKYNNTKNNNTKKNNTKNNNTKNHHVELSRSEIKDLTDDIKWAFENDVIAAADQTIVQERANEYELIIESFLKKNNIRYMTQLELQKVQEKIHGRPLATPDFLLIDNVYLNNYPIRWIDAKHMYGANLQFLKKSLEKQVKKYNHIWGYGALFFSASYSELLNITGAMLISMEKPPHAKIITG